MAWSSTHDAQQYRDAARLQKELGLQRWMILWGPGSRRYWAYLVGATTTMYLSAPSIDQLSHTIGEAERHLAQSS